MPLTLPSQMFREIQIKIKIQDQNQVPAGQVPAQVPIQPVPQLAPAPLAPAGVVPVPQIIYQNWIGKKPEFSGKPEEDARISSS